MEQAQLYLLSSCLFSSINYSTLVPVKVLNLSMFVPCALSWCVLSGQFTMKHLKISCEINDNKKGRTEWEIASFKTLKIKWQNKDNWSRLLRNRSKGHRICFAGKFSLNHHIHEKQDSPSNKNIILKREIL